MQSVFEGALNRRSVAPDNGPARSAIGFSHRTQFCYDGRFWCVPHDFKFPQMKLRQGWQCWLRGLPGNKSKHQGESVNAPIAPFRKLTSNLMKPKMGIKFRGDIAPVFQLMEKAPGFVPSESYTQAELDECFDQGIEYIKVRISYIFEDLKWKDYTVSTFCKKLKASSIRKYGSDSDKAHICETVRNRARPRRR